MTSNMKPKIIKIHYPSKNAGSIAEVTGVIRDNLLDSFPNNQVSYSFSSNKQSGYIMVYPAQPIFTIRVSNHDDNGQAAPPQKLIEAGRTTIVNAEADGGQAAAEQVVLAEMMEAIKSSAEIKQYIRNNSE